ncbi:MAG: hypothetical protein Q9228_004481 [Teloschistes exilis]
MDLRPQNILVFASPEAGPVGSWKISDFGISSFKKFQNTKEQTYLSIRDLAEMHTSIPTDRNIEGAHRSPENHGSHKGSYSGQKSDMWSYACVLVEVLAFALGSNRLLSEFRKLKVQGDEDGNYAFFTMKISASADGSNECSVKLSVLDWLKVLGKRFLENRLWVDDLVKLILAVLRIVPEERLTAQEVYSVHVFSTIDEDKNSTMKIIDELPPGVDWQTLKIANHYLSVVGWQSKLGTQMHLRDLDEAKTIAIPHELASSSTDIYPSSKGIIAFCGDHSVDLWDPKSSQKTTSIKFANSFLHTLAFNAAGDALFLWCRSTTTSDRIYVYDDRTEAEAHIIPSISESTCILHLPNRGLLVVEAKPEIPKRKLPHAEKKFKRPQIAHAATDKHLISIDVDYNIRCWPLVRTQGFLELEGHPVVLGHSHRFSGKISFAALSKAEKTIIVTACSKEGEFEAQQYTLPV